MGLITPAFLWGMPAGRGYVCSSPGELQGWGDSGTPPVPRGWKREREEGRKAREAVEIHFPFASLTPSLLSFLALSFSSSNYFIFTTPTAIRFGSASETSVAKQKKKEKKETDWLFRSPFFLGFRVFWFLISILSFLVFSNLVCMWWDWT